MSVSNKINYRCYKIYNKKYTDQNWNASMKYFVVRVIILYKIHV